MSEPSGNVEPVEFGSPPESVLALDAADTLAGKLAEFSIPEGVVYMDGNSLGPLPLAARSRVAECVEQEWGRDLIKSWNLHDWIDLPVITGEKIAPLIGAAPGQVICCDSISVNLFKLLACALALNPGRRVVVSEAGNFPTDLYMVEGLAGLQNSGSNAGGCELIGVAKSEILAALNSDVAVLMLTHVDFRSGEMLDMADITAAAHAVGALVIWDLAHSAGAVPVALDECKVDFAVGCGYKYLNGGPGSPAFVYVAERHQAACQQPLAGWMGHARPFAFDPSYAPADGIRRFLAGTPNILSMAALDGALDVFTDVPMSAVRKKSLGLAELFMQLVEASPALDVLKLESPREPEVRGSQLAWSYEAAFAISQALIEQQVIVDFRAPDIVRFGFTPLYLRYADVWRAVKVLEHIIESGLYKEPRFSARDRVT